MSNEPRVLAVIPARGGSKRFPRKNVYPLRGHPLIAYTIKAAADARRVTDWLVSTDDDEIAEVARRYGAPVPFKRPADLAGDADRNNVVVRHAMDFMEAKTGRRYDILILLQPTCPIRSAAHIDQAVELLWASPLETLASVGPPIKKRDPNVKAIRNGELVPYNERENPAQWDAAHIYNASIYAMKRDFFLRENSFVSQHSVPLVMDRFHSADIDERVDAVVVEAYFDHLGLDPFGDREPVRSAGAGQRG
ncbi:MAG TPA: acylneuraminate cytidylyltransferase family protein [Xanthobacteraceae bacterium]|nr:acylneuraminate cytidylyltransferase family protein [Xanthobacteraceae bacterium]